MAAGATVHFGAKRDGTFYWPTVLSDVPATARVITDEVFGPVVSVEPFDSVDRVIATVNKLEYRLQAGVFTSDIDHALDVAERLRVGAVMINDISDFRIDAMPFGGSKRSGIGREGVPFAVDAMTEPKIIAIHRTARHDNRMADNITQATPWLQRLFSRHDRELFSLAMPALAALITQPLLLIDDTAIIGRLGTVELAGVSVASAVLLNAVLLCVFLAYGTNSSVAWRAGAGDLRGAYTQGVGGIWLAISVGLVLGLALLALALCWWTCCARPKAPGRTR